MLLVLDSWSLVVFFFFFQAEDGIRDVAVTGVQTCALPIYPLSRVLKAAGMTKSGVIQSFLRADPNPRVRLTRESRRGWRAACARPLRALRRSRSPRGGSRASPGARAAARAARRAAHRRDG